eukprot:SAG31_NODE_6635_length_1943_cov_1.693601_1_plen_406_part_10
MIHDGSSSEKLIGTVDGESDMGGPTLAYPEFWDQLAGGFRGPWAENMTAFVGQRWRRWMGEYKRLGGHVDVLHVDAEWHGWYISHGFAEQRSSVTNATGIWEAMAADPRWPSLQARLNLAGKAFGADFADITDMASWQLNSTTDLRAHVWDAVMFQRNAEIVNASYFEPVREAGFPAVKCSNYGHTYTPPPKLWTYMSGTSEGHPPFAGPGAHVGTHQSKSFYTPSNGLAAGCEVAVGPSSRMNFCWNWGTPFWERKLVAEPLDYAVLLASTTRIRGMVAANPHVPVMPWLEPKSSVTYPVGGSYLADSDMYQEMVLHMALTGVSEFLFWHAGPPRCCFCGRLGACRNGKTCSQTTSQPAGVSCPDPPSNLTETITVGVPILNQVLAEADALVGTAERSALILDAP